MSNGDVMDERTARQTVKNLKAVEQDLANRKRANEQDRRRQRAIEQGYTLGLEGPNQKARDAELASLIARDPDYLRLEQDILDRDAEITALSIDAAFLDRMHKIDLIVLRGVLCGRD